MEDLLGIKDAAQYLAVSVATLRNWERHGYLTIQNATVSREAVYSLQQRLLSGELRRLDKRASKIRLASRSIPREYLLYKDSARSLKAILEHIAKHRIGLDTALFLLALNLFGRTGDLDPAAYLIWLQQSGVKELQQDRCRRKAVSDLLKSWYRELNPAVDLAANPAHIKLLTASLPEEEDLLGLVYQSLRPDGQQASFGSFFTPREIVQQLLSGWLQQDMSVCDPCCGTGQFLLAFAREVSDPEQIQGIDIDPRSVRIAALNLLLLRSDRDFQPKLVTADSLLRTPGGFWQGSFDLVATNPPWGARYTADTRRQLGLLYPTLKTAESFSFFTQLCCRLAGADGLVCLLLPESFAYVRAHADIREFLLTKAGIKEIRNFGRCFRKVFSPVVGICLQRPRTAIQDVNIYREAKSYLRTAEEFKTNPCCIIDFHADSRDRYLCSLAEKKPKLLLAGQALWALGIVTGDNKQLLSTHCQEGQEAVYTGRNVHAYRFDAPEYFLHFDPQRLQQTADPALYRAPEKLVYRFVSRRLVFACDTSGALTLNSANILIPQINGLSIKALLGILNSDFMSFYFAQRFRAVKVLRQDLELLPLPRLDSSELVQLEKLVDEVIVSNQGRSKVDKLIYQWYGIDGRDQDYIKGCIAHSAGT